jgi:hypothetical protein
MSFLSALLSGGDTVKVIGDTVDKLFTSDEERLAQKVELDKAEKAYKIRELELSTSLIQGQIDINKVEASSTEIFVAGWRPFVGWVCGFALAYTFIVEPILRFIAQVVFGYTGLFPVIETSDLNSILLGMLGLGGLRTFEKVKGVS